MKDVECYIKEWDLEQATESKKDFLDTDKGRCLIFF